MESGCLDLRTGEVFNYVRVDYAVGTTTPYTAVGTVSMDVVELAAVVP